MENINLLEPRSSAGFSGRDGGDELNGVLPSFLRREQLLALIRVSVFERRGSFSVRNVMWHFSAPKLSASLFPKCPCLQADDRASLGSEKIHWKATNVSPPTLAPYGRPINRLCNGLQGWPLTV